MMPIAAEIATRLNREHAQSALPDAPVVPYEDRRPAPSRLASLARALVSVSRSVSGSPGRPGRAGRPETAPNA